MANTITQRTLFGAGDDRRIIRLINIVSDGTQESGLVIYDNSAFVDNATKGRLDRLTVSGSSCILRLEWDQTANSPIISINPAGLRDKDFESIGGISNPAEAGATGDMVLTTAELAAGDEVTLLIEVVQG